MVTIIRYGISPSDPAQQWALLAAQASNLDWYSLVIEVTTSNMEAYVAANEAALEISILSTGTLDETLNEASRIDNKTLRWVDGDDNLIAKIEVGLNGAMTLHCTDAMRLESVDGFQFDGADVVLLNGGDLTTLTGLISALQGNFAGNGIILADDGGSVATVTAERVKTPLISDTFNNLKIDHAAVQIDCPLTLSVADATKWLFQMTSTENTLTASALNLGNDQPGSIIYLGRNTAAGAAGPAPGAVAMRQADDSGWQFMVPDDSGIWRTGNNPPTGNTASATRNINTYGTVVGTQTSSRTTKDIEGEFVDNAEALRLILATPLYVFRYKSGAYGGEQFTGIVAEESPEFAMDNGKSFNPVSSFGYTVAAIKELERQNRELRNQLGNLTKRLEKIEQ